MALGLPPSSAWGCFGGSLQGGFSVPLALGAPPTMALGSPCIGDSLWDGFWMCPQQFLCFGGSPQGAFGTPLASRVPTGVALGAPACSQCSGGSLSSALVSPCLGTPPGMAPRLPPRSTQNWGRTQQCFRVPHAVLLPCGAPPVLPWGRAAPATHPPPLQLALELAPLGGPLDKQQDTQYNRPPKGAGRSPRCSVPCHCSLPSPGWDPGAPLAAPWVGHSLLGSPPRAAHASRHYPHRSDPYGVGCGAAASHQSSGKLLSSARQPGRVKAAGKPAKPPSAVMEKEDKQGKKHDFFFFSFFKSRVSEPDF